MAKLSLSIIQAAEAAEFFTSDSRLAKGLGVFVALKGQERDGHDFIETALKQKIFCVVLSKFFAQSHGVLLESHPDTHIIPVDDTAATHRELAKLFRKKFQTPILAIGGSAGKTTTKEFLYALVAPYRNAIKTQASQNGEQGIPKTLEQLRADTELAVVEIGIDNVGDMQRHVELVEPNCAALTSIGEEHLQQLKNIETVFAEERRLLDFTLKYGGKCFVPMEDPWLAKISEHSALRRVSSKQDPAFESPFFGKHVNANLNLAIAMAMEVGITSEEIRLALPTLQVPEGRGRIETVGPHLKVVADYYNSNPDSLKAGLQALSQHPQFKTQSKHLILGDMFDLGLSTERAHQSVVPAIQALAPTSVILVGAEMSKLKTQIKTSGLKCFSSTDEAAQVLSAKMFQGVIFLKASRGMAFEKILTKLMAMPS